MHHAVRPSRGAADDAAPPRQGGRVGSGERAVEMFELTQLNEHLRSEVKVTKNGVRCSDVYVSDLYRSAAQARAGGWGRAAGVRLTHTPGRR